MNRNNIPCVSDLAIDDYEALERKAEAYAERRNEMINLMMTNDDAFDILFEYMIDYDQMLPLMKMLRTGQGDWCSRFAVSLVEKVVTDHLEDLEYELKWRNRIY